MKMDIEKYYDDRNTDEAEGSVKGLDRDDESIRSDDSEGDNDTSEDEKQMEDDTPCHKRLQSIVKAIKRKEIDWSKPKEYFGSKHQGRFSAHLTEQSERNEDCILHFLVKDDDATPDETRELAKAIKYVARFHPRLVTVKNKELVTPLYCALDNLDRRRAYLIKNGFFKFGAKTDQMAKQMTKAIGMPCGLHDENCLHRALKAQPVDYTVLNLLVGSTNRQSVDAKDGQNWTPLHRAAQFEHSSQDMLNIIKRLIAISEPESESSDSDSLPAMECAFDTYSGPGRDKLSVYEYHLKTREEEEQREKTRVAKSYNHPPPMQNEKKDDPKQKKDEVRPQDQSNDKNRQMGKDEGKVGEIQRTSQKEKDNGALINRERGREYDEDGEIPNPGLVRANTNAKRVAFPDGNANAKSIEKKDSRAERRQERERWSQEILNALKLHCLRTRTIAQATRFLYGTNKDGQLFF